MSLFQKIRRLLQSPSSADEPEDPLMARVVLLLEAATYDHVFAPEERALIVHLLEDHYGLDPEEARETLALAAAERDRFPDIQSFTRRLIPHMSNPEREQLMMELWLVIYADDKLDPNEEHFARKMLTLLRLDRTQWLAAKQAAQDYLAEHDLDLGNQTRQSISPNQDPAV